MGYLDNGIWRPDWYKADEEGRFNRPQTVFHGRVSSDGSTPHPVEKNRYHLYVSYACPWAHRTLISRSLLGLDDITVSVVDPFMSDEGWHFGTQSPGATVDHIHGAKFLRDVYLAADPHYTGRVTVPVLWDKKLNTIVNNESREILRMFSTQFAPISNSEFKLAPEHLIPKIDAAISDFYEPINNGVYRAGFATSQSAYDAAVKDVFNALEKYEKILESQRFVVGNQITEADICLFTTLVRFDAVYVSHFKCNLKNLREFPNLWGFTRDVFQTRGVAETVEMTHIKRHYFESHPMINPTRIVPAGPELDFLAPHNRA